MTNTSKKELSYNVIAPTSEVLTEEEIAFVAGGQIAGINNDGRLAIGNSRVTELLARTNTNIQGTVGTPQPGITVTISITF